MHRIKHIALFSSVHHGFSAVSLGFDRDCFYENYQGQMGDLKTIKKSRDSVQI